MGSCSVSARNKQTLMGPAEFSAGAKGRFRFCLGGEGVWNILGFIPSPSVPLLGITASKFCSSPAWQGSG